MNFDTFDASYIDRLRCADAATEQHFVHYFSELILLKLRSRLRSKQAIEDVKQETFARTFALLRSEGGIRNAERLGPLVNSICNNILSEQYRSDGRADPLEDEAASLLVEHRPDALSTILTKDTGDHVRKVLASLSTRDRGLLRALFFEERDKDELCQEMGIDRDYIRVLLHRAKISFRKAYAEQEKGVRTDIQRL